MTTTISRADLAQPPATAAGTPAPSLRKGRRAGVERNAVSPSEWKRPGIRYGLGLTQVVLLVLLVVAGLGPMLMLAKFAVTPTQDILSTPLALFPNGIEWGNLEQAWNRVHVDRYFMNTVWLALGSWAVQVLVATTGGFVLSVLRPAYGKVLQWLVLATMFVPAVVLLVPLYLIILHPPLLGHSLINSFWAVWLPSGASAFNVLLVSRFFDSLPREVFEAARVDGAGTFRLFWWVLLPMSRPILGVVSIFAIISSWKDFLWPLLVLKDPNIQPLSVRLPAIAGTTDLGVFLAALSIATLIPIALFLAFQNHFLNGVGFSGAVKG